MKKLLSLLLAITLVLCLCACGSSTAQKTATVKIKDDYKGQLRAGYGRVSIMPYFSMPLAGYGNTEKRLSVGSLDDIYTSCTAVTDEKNNTMIIFSVDLINLLERIYDPITKEVSKQTGVPVSNIMVNCSHTHSAPDCSVTKMGAVIDYNGKLPEKFAKAAVEALNDRKPAKMFYSDIQTASLNFVRHYVGDDGTYLGDNHNDLDYKGTILKHATESDHTLFLLKFKREGAKDIFLTSFRAHAQMTGGVTKTDISSDWVGAYRKEVEEKLNCHCSYLQGGAGNQNPKSKIESETIYKTHTEHGQALAKFMITASENMQEVKNTIITFNEAEYVGKVNHTEDNKLRVAQMVAKEWNSSNNSADAKRLAEANGLASQYHANAVISKAALPATKNFKVHVAAIGDVAFSFAPFEQFDTNGRYVMDNSPYKYTIACGYSNGSNSYIPSSAAYGYGCYEADVSRYVPGTGEEVAELQTKLLKEMQSKAKK